MRLLFGWTAMAAVLALALLVGGADTVHATTFNPTLAVAVDDPTPGAPSDVVANFDLPSGDVNFAAVVNFIPRDWGVVNGADIPIGMQTGVLDAESVLGLANGACNTQLPVQFDMLNASINTTDTVPFADTEFDLDSLDPDLTDGEKKLAEYEASGDVGTTADFADDIEYVVKEGDTIEEVSDLLGISVEDLVRINGIDQSKPLDAGKVIGNGIFDGIDKYPEFLKRVFKDDDSGEILQPLRRSAGVTPVAGTPVFLQFLIFPPGTKLPTRGSNVPLPSNEALGYPSVTVLQSIGDPEAKPAPSIINDFCTPLATINRSYGQERDEDGNIKPDGVKFFVNPQDGKYTWTTVAFGQRDADGDSYENSLDTCPLTPNVGNPRITSDGDADGDGLDQACDPNDAVDGGTNSDQDGDGYSNRNDNCPLVANGEEEDNQKDDDLDQIGNACDPDPAVGNGDLSSATVTSDVTIGAGTGPGGPPTAAQCPDCFTGVIPTHPAGDGGTDTVAPGPDDGGGGGATIAIVIGVIAAVVILGGGAVLAMRRKSSS